MEELKQLQDEKQKAIQTHLESLTATEATEYSLWKATKKLKRPQTPPPLPLNKNWPGRMGKK
jgi:2-phosphoglycerate kinase